MTASCRQTQWLLAAFALIAVLFCWPLYSHLDYWGIQDWDAFLTRNSVSRQSVVQYGQFPLWNPYSMGGVPQLAHPETNCLSLPFFIDLLCGVLIGIRVSIVLHLFLGLAGMYALARHLRLGVTASVLSAFLFMLNSMYGLFLATGASSIGLAIAYMPWAMVFFLKAFARFSFALACGAMLTLMWLQGGTYNFFLILLMMAVYALVMVVFREQGVAKMVRLLATICVSPLLLGAVRFFPSLEFTLKYPRKIMIYSGFSVEALLYGLLGRDQTIAAIVGKSEAQGFWQGYTHAMDEVGMYIGLLPCLLSLAGIGWLFLPKRWAGSAAPGQGQPLAAMSTPHSIALLCCLGLSLWLAFGNRCAPVSLWALINQVPPFSFMRTSERFRFTIMLFVALFAGIGLQAGKELVARKFGRPLFSQRLARVLVIAILADLFWVNSPALEDAFSIPPLPTPHSASFVQLGGFPEYGRQGIEPTGDRYHLYRTYGAMYPAFLSNAGSVYALESVPAPTKAIILTDPAYRGEVFLEGATGTAEYTLWSPNRLTIQVEAQGEGWVVVNQNYYDGWHEKNGLRVEEVNGLLAVRVSPAIKMVELYYRPTSFVVGAVVSLISLIGGIGWFRWLRKGER
jgi:hypothetical protein